MKLSNQPIVDVPQPWLWTMNGLIFAPLLTARLWFQPGVLDGAPAVLRSWIVILPWMLLGLLAHNLLRRWAAARGTPVVRVGELVVRHLRWLGELPVLPAIVLGLGAGVAFAAFLWLSLPIMAPPDMLAEPTPWWVAIFAVVVGEAFVFGRRHVVRLYLTDNSVALAQADEVESPTTADIGWPDPPWRLYGAWAVLYVLATAIVVLTPTRFDLAWLAKVAPYPMAWIGGLIFHLLKPRRGPSWRVYTLAGSGKAAAWGALYVGVGFGLFFAPLGLFLGSIGLGRQPLAEILYPALVLAGGVLYGAVLGLWVWAINASALWVPKPAKAR